MVDETPDTGEPPISPPKQSKLSIFLRKIFSRNKSVNAATQPATQRRADRVLRELSVLIFLGALLGFLFGVVQPQDRWIYAFNGAGIALASAAAGALLGLLFGVPRALAGSPHSTTVPQAPAAPTVDSTGANSSSMTGGAGGYAPNTNLEEV